MGTLTAGRNVIVKTTVCWSVRPLRASVAKILTWTLTGVAGGLPEGAVRTTGMVSGAPLGRAEMDCGNVAVRAPAGVTVAEYTRLLNGESPMLFRSSGTAMVVPVT